MDAENYVDLNVHTITNRGTEYNALATRILTYLEALEEETDEAKAQADEDFRRSLTQMTDRVTTLGQDLVVLKTVSRLNIDIEKDVCRLEGLKAAEPDKDYSSCFKPIDKILEQIRQLLKDSTLSLYHQVYQHIDLMAERLLKLRAGDKVEDKPTTIIRSEYNRDFNIPKINIPKFKGGLEAW